MSPVAIAVCRQLLPAFNKEDTGVAYLARPSLVQLEAIHKVILVFFAVRKTGTVNIAKCHVKIFEEKR